MIQIEATEEFEEWLKRLRDLQAKVRIFDPAASGWQPR